MMKLFLILTFYFNFKNCFEIDTTQKRLRVDRIFTKCPKYRNLPVQAEKIKFVQTPKGFLLNMEIVLKQTIKGKKLNQFITHLHRCQSKEALDTCEPLLPITISNACGMLQTAGRVTGGFIGPALRAIKPPLTCPLKPGKHVMINGTVDINRVFNVIRFPIEGLYWKLEIHFTDTTPRNNVLFCIGGEGQIVNYRNK